MQPERSGEVLGINYEFSVVGTPLIPPTYITAYFIGFFVLVFFSYVFFYFRKRPVLLWHRVQLLVVIAFVLKISLLGGGLWLAVFWLVPPPQARLTDPTFQSTAYSPTSKIEINFDRPVSRSTLEKSITPDTPGRWVFESAFYGTHFYRKLVFYPTYNLRPGTEYKVRLGNIKNLIGVFNPYDNEFAFMTRESPRVKSVTPADGQERVTLQSDIVIALDTPNYRVSEFDVTMQPSVPHDVLLDDTKTAYIIRPKEGLQPGTTYRVNIQKTDLIFNLDEAVLEERGLPLDEYTGTFTTVPESDISLFDKLLNAAEGASVSAITPKDGWTAVNVHSPVKVQFDREVDRESAEAGFGLSPDTPGVFSWNENTMFFTPASPFSPTSTYTVTLDAGIMDSNGIRSREAYESTFVTQNATTKLTVPAYLQKYTLSCEIASLRMALNYRSLSLSEDDLIPKVGQDSTPHNGNIWGNPNIAFVGNIAGTQMVNGYGVHWAPIAKAAKEYRSAADFTGWDVGQLTKEIENNNPVIIWVYSHHGTPTSWRTPDGAEIYAVRDEHAVVAVGFVGPAVNPTQIIVNDPLIGQVYWPRAEFDRKWNIFNRSGVVVY